MKNVFDTPYGKDAIERMNFYGITNIRYSLIEKHGMEKVKRDLVAKVGSPCEVKIHYDSHKPDDLVQHFYCGDWTYTVMIPIMPTVTIEKIKKN